MEPLQGQDPLRDILMALFGGGQMDNQTSQVRPLFPNQFGPRPGLPNESQGPWSHLLQGINP